MTVKVNIMAGTKWAGVGLESDLWDEFDTREEAEEFLNSVLDSADRADALDKACELHGLEYWFEIEGD